MDIETTNFENFTVFKFNTKPLFYIYKVITNYSFSIMDEKLRQKLRIKRVREMKNPTIFMNETDFEVFKNEIESKTTVVVGDNLTYQGVPIKTSQIIEKGNIVVYDDVSNN